jgi:hypothetical protein
LTRFRSAIDDSQALCSEKLQIRTPVRFHAVSTPKSKIISLRSITHYCIVFRASMAVRVRASHCAHPSSPSLGRTLPARPRASTVLFLSNPSQDVFIGGNVMPPHRPSRHARAISDAVGETFLWDRGLALTFLPHHYAFTVRRRCFITAPSSKR